MATQSFKGLVVWQKSVELVVLTYEITKLLPKSESYGLVSQMQRAAVSIPSNIAEGYMRNNRKEYIQFCSIAAGSAAELETQMLLVNRLYESVDTVEAANYLSQIQKMLHVLIGKLKTNP